MTVSGKIDRKNLDRYVCDLSQKNELVNIRSTSTDQPYHQCNGNQPEDMSSFNLVVQNTVSKALGGTCEEDTSIFYAGATSITVVHIVQLLQPLSISAAEIYELKTPKEIARCLLKNAKKYKQQKEVCVTTSSAAGQFLLAHSSKCHL